MAEPIARHRRTESLARPAAQRYRGEQIRLSNRDAHTGYGLGLRLARPDGRVITSRDVYLGAGTTTRLYDVCPVGPVSVTVDHAGQPVDTVTAQLDESEAGTIAVQCREGDVSARTGVP